MNKIKKAEKYIKWIILSFLVGILAGLSSYVFLAGLQSVTQIRQTHQWIIWFLPLAGLLIGWSFNRYGKEISSGNNLILDEIHDSKKVIPFRMAPFILFGTLATHLFGGSAGREGTAVQMGASLSDQLSHLFKLNKQERKILLIAGAGAGFGAAVGTPLAGAIFGMEVMYIGKFKSIAILECLIASYTATFLSKLLNAPHTHYPLLEIEPITLKTLFLVSFCGVLFGFAARFFIQITHIIEKLYKKLIKNPVFRPLIGGVIISIGFSIEKSYRYAGLGITTIVSSLESPANWSWPLLKGLFTSLTIGSGFKGGEFIPLVFIGTTMGSALSIIIPVSHQILASVGFSAVFGAASNTPLACAIMGIELFGLQATPYLLIGCFMSYFSSGYLSIYTSQPIGTSKHYIFTNIYEKIKQTSYKIKKRKS